LETSGNLTTPLTKVTESVTTETKAVTQVDSPTVILAKATGTHRPTTILIHIPLTTVVTIMTMMTVVGKDITTETNYD